MFTGCGTALVTPFKADLSLDEQTLRALIRRQIEAGISFIVPCGTTGESPTLSHDEHVRVVQIAVEEAKNNVPVLAGAGGYDTRHVIRMIADLKAVGVSGILSVTPYYNKPTQEGLYQHFRAIAESTELPIVLYSVQARTNVNIEPATVLRLAEIKNIVGIKEASGNISQIGSIIARVPSGFLVLSGDDAMTIPLIALGGHGVISVISNQIPAEMTQLAQAALANDFDKARSLQRQYQSLMELNFVETSPGPVKFTMSRMGLLQPVWRLPMVPPSQAAQEKLQAALDALSLTAGARA